VVAAAAATAEAKVVVVVVVVVLMVASKDAMEIGIAQHVARWSLLARMSASRAVLRSQKEEEEEEEVAVATMTGVDAVLHAGAATMTALRAAAAVMRAHLAEAAGKTTEMTGAVVVMMMRVLDAAVAIENMG